VLAAGIWKLKDNFNPIGMATVERSWIERSLT